MSKNIMITDHTLNAAVSAGIPDADIQLIAQILQKYPVACFDIEAGNVQMFPAIRTLLPDFMMRYTVRPSDAIESKELRRLGRVRIKWRHEENIELDLLYKTAQAAGSDVYLGLENAGDIGFNGFKKYFEFAGRAHIKGIIYGCGASEDVLGLAEKLAWVRQNAPCAVEFDGSNRLGLAAAQSLAALKAGIQTLSASVAGLGGLTPMEEILMAAKHLWQYDIPQGRELAADFQLILSLLGVETPANKGLIGPDVFAHESGIHVDGVIKNPSIYEVIRPEDVGLKRKFVIGKHSGTAALKNKGLQWGIKLSNDEAAEMLETVREQAQRQKGPLSDRQLQELFRSAGRKKEAHNEAVF